MGRSRKSGPAGVLVIDKPAGLTSHDVVARVRKALSTRRVGHAGTLDPLATGVLLVMVGEATKLAPYLTAADKRYEATVQLGSSTDTLDAEGAITAEAALPSWWHDEATSQQRLTAALERERARREQIPPAYSAIKIAGRSAHARARAGQQLVLAPRPVSVRELQLVSRSLEAATVQLRLAVSKGYYVRSLARDLGSALDLPAHLSQLRRTASGAFQLSDACPVDGPLAGQLMSLEAAAAQAMPIVKLTTDGVRHARHGAIMLSTDFLSPPPPLPSAWCDEEGRLVAIGEAPEGKPAVLRGFVPRRDSGD